MPCMIHTWQHWSYSPVLCHHKHHRSSHPSSVCVSVTTLHYQLAWCLKERVNWQPELCCRCGPAGSGQTSQRWTGKRTRQSLHFAQRVAWWMPLWSGRVPNPLHPKSSHHHWPVAMVTLKQSEQWLFLSNVAMSSHHYLPVAYVRLLILLIIHVM